MLFWLIAAGAALAFAVLQYATEPRAASTRGAAALRFVAALLAVALVLDAPRGRAAVRASLVVLDASESWQRGRPDSDWESVRARAVAAARGAGDTLWYAGDSLRATHTGAPADANSRVAGAVERALAQGRPLELFTDGELDDVRALERVLAGSRIHVEPLPGSGVRDAAVLGLDVPRSVVGGDSVEVVVRVVAGAGGAAAGAVALTLDGAPLGRTAFDSIPPFSERDVRAMARVPAAGEGIRVLRAVASSPGDGVGRNDTLATALEVAAAPRAVFVSTAPDQDARFALEVLRGTLAIAVRAFYRVAPGTWRQEPGFTPATEADVRAALGDAPVAIIHGDTAHFGAPRTLVQGALALIVPTTAESDEWYVAAVPQSPLSPALAGLPFDSLPPLALGPAPRGDWSAAVARRPRVQRDDRAFVVGSAAPRRVVVVAASGLWRWRFRGGASADAFAALWGGVFDWMAVGGDDRRGAVPVTGWARAGETIAWRRGARQDSIVVATLRSSAHAGADSVTLRFPGDAIVAESSPLPEGDYEISVPGGRTRLVVGASREWIPRRPSVESGSIGTAQPSGLAPRLRDAWWAYVLLLAALCTEWFVRRRAGLR